jgi:hypothetical protein
MNGFDTGAGQGLSAPLHYAYCVPGTNPDTVWTEEHRRRDERKALEVIDGLDAGGYDVARRVRS